MNSARAPSQGSQLVPVAFARQVSLACDCSFDGAAEPWVWRTDLLLPSGGIVAGAETDDAPRDRTAATGRRGLALGHVPGPSNGTVAGAAAGAGTPLNVVIFTFGS